MKALIALILFLSATAAYSANWVHIDNGDSDGRAASVYYNRKEIKHVPYSYIWSVIVRMDVRTGKNTYEHNYAMYKFDCRSGSYDIIPAVLDENKEYIFNEEAAIHNDSASLFSLAMEIESVTCPKN